MLHRMNKLQGYMIQATDADVGKLDEFFFDDARWSVRYVVVDTGNWLTGRRVLLPPGALGKPNRESHVLPVSLTRKQVEDSPDIDTEKPITRQQEDELRRHFGWSNYWFADPLLGDPNFTAGPLGMSPASMAAIAREPAEGEEQGDPHLESARDVIGYHIQAVGGEIGHVEDFVVDEQNWSVRYISVDTRNWLPGKTVLIAPQWVEKMDWVEAKVHVGLERDQIRHSPPYDPAEPIDREYEARLYEYYGKPAYWG
jgi:hypothetical protein